MPEFGGGIARASEDGLVVLLHPAAVDVENDSATVVAEFGHQ